jgi:hypothetical protein
MFMVDFLDCNFASSNRDERQPIMRHLRAGLNGLRGPGRVETIELFHGNRS